MPLLPFQQGDTCLWNGSPCVVEEVRGERIVLRRIEDDFMIITSERTVHGHQPSPEMGKSA